MLIHTSQESLSRALSIVGRAVASKSTLQALTHVLLETQQSDQGGQLKLSASNQEIAITTAIAAEVEDAGAITLPAKLLTEFINSLPRGQVALSLNDRTKAVNVKGGKSKGNIKGLHPDEFLPLPSVDAETLCTLQAAALKTAIQQVAWSAATDDTRPVLAGVLLTFAGEALTLAAADGFTLAVKTLKLSTTFAENVTLLIPAASLNEVARLCDEGDVSLSVKGNMALFAFGGVSLVTRTLEDRFPNYQQIIPTSFTTRATASTAELLRAVKVAGFFNSGGKEGNPVRFTVNGGENGASLNVKNVATESGEGETEMDVSLEGQNGHIALDVARVSNALNAAMSERVTLCFNAANQPCLARAEGDESWISVLMPMHSGR